MALTTYTELKASVADWLNRTDLTAVIPDFIRLVEAELGRVLDGRGMRTELPVTFDTSGRLTVPSDFQRPVSLTLETSTYAWPIQIKPYDYLVQKRLLLEGSGPPVYASLVADQFVFAPTPDGDYTGTLVYDSTVTALSASNASNWVLTGHPDVYVFGSLYHAAPYLKDDERIPVWEGKYRSALDQIRTLAIQSEYGTNTPVVKRLNPLGV